MPAAHRLNGGLDTPHIMENVAMQVVYREGPQPKTDWPQQQQEIATAGTENQFSSGTRGSGPAFFSSQGSVGQGNSILFGRDDQPTNTDAAIAEQRGVSHLSNAVSAAATNGSQSRPQMARASPSAEQVSGLGQMAAGINGDIGSLASGNQLGLEKRGPVEFNHAIGYVNKIKVSKSLSNIRRQA